MKPWKKIALALALTLGISQVAANELHDLKPVDAENVGAASDGFWSENMAPSAVNNAARANLGMIAREASDRSVTKDYGPANALRVTSNRTINSLFDGLMFTVQVTNDNTGAATFQVGTLTKKDLKKKHDIPLAAGDVEHGQTITVAYSASDDQFQLLTPVASFATPTKSCFLFYNSVTDDDETGNNTEVTVDFNIEVYDQAGNFASDTFTAPITGIYSFVASVRFSDLDGNVTQTLLTIVTSNGTYYDWTVAAAPNETTRTINFATIADMDVGDTAVVKLKINGIGADTADIEAGAGITFFSGCLIS